MSFGYATQRVIPELPGGVIHTFARSRRDFHGIFPEYRNFPVKRLEEFEINVL